MKKAALLRARHDNLEFDRIAVFAIDDNGVVQLELIDKSDPKNLVKALDGITLLSEKRTVTAKDGEVFLEAMAQFYTNTSYYRFADETNGPAESKHVTRLD